MSTYPDAFDVFPVHQDPSGLTSEVIYAEDINSLARAISAIQTELGLVPRGSFLTVADRIVAGGFFRFIQSTPQAQWQITHNLGGYPNVTVVDSAGSVVVGDVTYTSITDLTVDFSAGFAGEAYLS